MNQQQNKSASQTRAAGTSLIPRFPLLGFLINYELLEFFRSWLACCVPFLASVLLFAFGSRVWIALLKLIAFVPVPTGQIDPLGGTCPVISDFMQAKLIRRYLLKLAAATH